MRTYITRCVPSFVVSKIQAGFHSWLFRNLEITGLRLSQAFILPRDHEDRACVLYFVPCNRTLLRLFIRESGRQEKSRLLSRLLGLIREYEDKRTLEGAWSQSGNFQLPDGFTWEEWEAMEKDKQGHGQDIDSWDGNQNSAVGVLVDSFVVYDKNGAGHRPEGYEPWNRAAAKADNSDHHKPAPPTKRKYQVGITLWHNTIPYEIDPNLGDKMISIIKESMKQLQELTCLKYIRAGPEHADLMYFTDIGQVITFNNKALREARSRPIFVRDFLLCPSFP